MEPVPHSTPASAIRYALPPRSVTVIALVGCYLLALASFITLAGAAVHRLGEVPAPGNSDSDEIALVLALLTCAGGVAAASGLGLAWRWPKWTTFTTILFLMLSGITIVAAEITARCWTPPWPARALHGVTPDADHQPWGLLGRRENQIGFNSWGQRDRERALPSRQSPYRIAFIGDSFLDETVSEPISLVTERLIDSTDVEVINLGVSATSPDEYYFRLANVAAPLGAEACVMFLYLGNDLAADPRTLPGTLGLTAVTPRGSLLTDLGMHGLNHVLTNHQRPILQAWGSAGELAEQERTLHKRFQTASDTDAVELLLALDQFPPPLQYRLRQHLNRQEMSGFLQMLREPDAGLFRSYFLVDSLWLAAVGQAPGTVDDIVAARHWIGLSHQLCQHRGLKFLLVVIPQGFAVDRRLQELWSPLADVARLTEKTEAAGAQLVAQLRQDGIDVLDLHAPLSQAPGAYLNLDGHWSEIGIRCAAEAIQAKIVGWPDAANLSTDSR